MKKMLEHIYSKFEESNEENLKEMEDKAFVVNGEQLGFKQRLIREYVILQDHFQNLNKDKTFIGLLAINKLKKEFLNE